jgi:GNAT superfamily N-acetyltransferase
VDDVVIRQAVASDRPLIDAMLVATVNWDANRPASPAAELWADRVLTRYVAGWPRTGDIGVVAEVLTEARQDGARRRGVGAAWCRRFPAEAVGYGFVDEDTPEVSIALHASWRRRGIGRRLLVALSEAARAAGVERLSLSVEDGNPARHLYEQVGYVEVRRVGGATVMVLDLLAG